MKETFLTPYHRKQGAKIVCYADTLLPLYFKGILEEHETVRNHAALFDLSHMGRIELQGNDVDSFLEVVSTNTHKNRKEGSATYTLFCNQDGGVIDDALIYKESSTLSFLIANGVNKEKVLNHLKKESKGFAVSVKSRFDEEGILAIQGPKSLPLLKEYFLKLSSLKPFTFIKERDLIVARTGYTGADGIECFGPFFALEELYKFCLQSGIEPAGLGARDTLRQEMGFALYGNELEEGVSALFSPASKTICFEKEAFIGKKALQKMKGRAFCAFILLEERSIPRQGNPLYYLEKEVGHVTSGTFSPTLKRPIAIARSSLSLPLGSDVNIFIRGCPKKGKVVKMPFIRKENRLNEIHRNT